MLAIAWTELESEQRRQLNAANQSTPVGTQSSPLQSNKDERRTTPTPDASNDQATNKSISYQTPAGELDLIDNMTANRAASAAAQFQKLKRDVRQHSQRDE